MQSLSSDGMHVSTNYPVVCVCLIVARKYIQFILHVAVKETFFGQTPVVIFKVLNATAGHHQYYQGILKNVP